MAGSNPAPHVILTPRDRQLLDELATLRVVDREQAMLFGGFRSVTRANARLLALTRAGYLRRTFVGTISGGRKAIYGLPGRHLNVGSRGPLAREKAFEHQLAINRVYHVFRYTRSPHPGVQFRSWQRFDQVLSPAVPLIPDGWVQIETPAETISAGIEVDLGTEPMSVWGKKVERYLRLAVSGEHEHIFGERRFRVLIVACGARRLESIRAGVSQQTNKLFWLTTSGELAEHGPWAPMWLRPASRTRSALLQGYSLPTP